MSKKELPSINSLGGQYIMVSRRMPVIRRILCTLLVCALLTGLLPAAFAAGSDPDFSAPADKVDLADKPIRS